MTARAKTLWFDGKMVPWEQAQVHVMSHAIHYGSSIFEGIRSYEMDGKPVVFRLHDHLKRFFDSARIYRWRIRYDINDLTAATYEVLQDNKLTNAYIRPALFLGEGSIGLAPGDETPIHTIVGAFPWGSYLGAEALEQGVDVMVSSWNRVAPNTLPFLAKAGGNYLSSQLIAQEARRLGFAEGIALDVNGLVAEGAGQNLFLVRDGVLITPPTIASILPGITRDTIIELAREEGIEVRETQMPREALYLADELFFTGTASEICPIRSVDNITIGQGKAGPITQRLQTLFFGLFNGKTKDTHNWVSRP